MIAPRIRCAIYTRKSTEEGLEQAFNSLDAQREAGEAYIASQKAEGWVCLPDRYDDGGYTGGNMDRPALKRLMADIEAGRIDCIVVYKVDRLSRSLLDFARIMGVFDAHKVSFVSVTQQFNTTTSMGRLTLNVLLSFAQFEREIISERTRDKIAAARRKGKWSGGMPVLGYDVDPKGGRIMPNENEAKRVNAIFDLYLEHQALTPTVTEMHRRGWASKRWVTRKGHERGGTPFTKGRLFGLLTNRLYLGKVSYKGTVYEGEHEGIVREDVWKQVQALLQRNGTTGGQHLRNKYGALLKGLLYCIPCDVPMSHTYTSRKNKHYRYYACAKAQKQGWDSCPTKSVPAPEIERFVVERIRAIGKDPGVLAETIQQARAQNKDEREKLEAERRTLQRELKGCSTELGHIVGDVGKDRNGHSPTTARLADLQDRIRVAEARAAEVKRMLEELADSVVDEKNVAESLSRFDPVWETLSPREQARIIQLLVERVGYDGESGSVSITFRPTGIKALAEQAEPQKGGRE